MEDKNSSNENQTSSTDTELSPRPAPEWIACRERLSPDGETVLTKIDDGAGVRNVQTLVRRGGLWFTGESGDAMYVYYTPTHWKPFTGEQKG